MKKLIFFFIFFISITIISKETNFKGKLIVKVVNIISNKGNIRAQLYKNPEAFPIQTEKAYKKKVSEISKNTSIIIFNNLYYGEYAVTVHHDEDLNGIMNRNFLGYPTEGWGVSQNPRIIFRLPSFEEAKFTINKEVTEIVIEINN